MQGSPNGGNIIESPDGNQQKGQLVNMWKITVKSVMQGVKEVVVLVPEGCSVQNLKLAIEMVNEVNSLKQVLLYKGIEMKNNEASIRDYGIQGDDEIVMNVKMSTGLFSKPTSTDMILLVPAILPENPEQLRKTIKGMNSVTRKPKKMSAENENARTWTPEKQLEAELTRNRMKTLLKRKKKTPHLSGPSTPVDSEPVSVQTYSPIATPPNELTAQRTSSGLSIVASKPLVTTIEDAPITDKELKLFFDPPETWDEYRRARKNFYLPPADEKELIVYEKKIAEDLKTKCNSCFKNLLPTQQTMHCKCSRVFCDKHRNPMSHMCVIDYKQDGRTKLKKETSKIGGGGARKAKFSESERA